MNIAIYGLGYVGLTAAGCLTKQGHSVLGVDVSDEKINEINAGRSPITEPGLADLLADAVADGRLEAMKHPGNRLDECDIAIVCVGTPSAPDGSHDMSYIAEVSRQIAATVSPYREHPLTVVYRSTIRPGSMDEMIRPIFKQVLNGATEKAVELVYNPEFLREATAVKDYFAPPKIVIGTRDGAPCANMDAMYADIEAPTFYTGFREAEFTKFVDNTFHAMKVAFANEIGRVCGQLGISAAKVHEIFVSDTKLNISPYYLRPGGAFGGSCLPKDVRALQWISADIGANTHLVDSLLRSNDAHKQFLFARCAQNLKPGSKVLMLGLAFKSDSDDLRESPNVDLARKFLQAGHELDIWDPSLEPAKLIGKNLSFAHTNLPTLSELLLTEDFDLDDYDLVVDTNGSSRSFAPPSRAPVVNLNALQ